MIFQAKMSNTCWFVTVNMRIFCFSLSFMRVNEEFGDSGLLVCQNKQTKDVF